MRILLTLVLLAACCPPAAQAQASRGGRAEQGAAKQPESAAQLQLTTSIAEQLHHCATHVGLKLRLKFKNTGSVPVILDKRSLVVRQMVGRDLEAMTAKQYESVGRYEYFGGTHFFDNPSDMTGFIILKAGDEYAFDTGIGSFSIYDGEKETPKGYLNEGTYFLQLVVGTWSYATDPEPFSRKWRNKGFLWSDGLTSKPMPFTVAKSDSSPPCL